MRGGKKSDEERQSSCRFQRISSTAHTPFFYVLNSFFPPLRSLSFPLDNCQMHTDDDAINVLKILPTVSSKQRKNSEFGFAHMICVPCDVSLSLPYMSLNKYCLNEKVNSCGCTVLGRCFFPLLSFNRNASALLCVPGVLVPMNRYCYRLNGLYSSRRIFALFIQYTRYGDKCKHLHINIDNIEFENSAKSTATRFKFAY